MTDNFPHFAALTAERFQNIVKQPNAYVVDVSGDALYEAYLVAFPEGTNPIFKAKSEHDCSCCKQFIRHVGNVVAVTDKGMLLTVWDSYAKAPPPYDTVGKVLRDMVVSARIVELFRCGDKETSFGAKNTNSINKETGHVSTWNHFHTGTIPKAFLSKTPDQVRGDFRTTVQVFERGLKELKPEAVEVVLSLIGANNLYRGEEHKHALLQFQKAQKEFLDLGTKSTDVFLWTNAQGPASRFRNTVMGTLVQDLSEGTDVERAVASFEAKVAPTNYKRTSAVITPGMVKKAMETIETLGLEPALERRFARIEDISTKDVLWVNGAVKPLMKGGIADALLKHAETANRPDTSKDETRAEEITIDAFVKRILPETTSMELLFKSEHIGNLMSLTAPVHPEPKQLFRWDNDFAWSYGGNVADSIKERVKKAGGKVEGALLRASLSWFNHDDLDIHVHEPRGKGLHGLGGHIFYGARQGWTGGTLDVDMNAGHGTSRQPVENIAWMALPPDGAYRVEVNNFAQREMSDVGFVVEVECGGKISHFSYNKAVRNKQDIHVVTLHMKAGRIERFEAGDDGISTSAVSQEKWGLHTESYVKVDLITLSPNYWGENAVGNKHTFFVLSGAKNDEPTRGIYNEFLHPRLEQHRKVFEIIGDKTKCQPTEGQLSGVGFSSTKKDSVIVKVTQGKKQRLFNVQIGA